MSLTEIPLFPLNTVLFPGGVLPLRIFEPRYVDMVRRCMREGGEFGIALIREGKEAGGPATTHDVGTVAQIVDFDQTKDGLLGITTRGTQRFRIQSTRRQADGLNLAMIEKLPPEPVVMLPDEYGVLARMLIEALPQMGDYFKHLLPQYDDAAWVSARVAEVMPIPLAVKQQMLEVDDGVERLRLLTPLLRSGADN
jgi:Lon protease-like protein